MRFRTVVFQATVCPLFLFFEPQNTMSSQKSSPPLNEESELAESAHTSTPSDQTFEAQAGADEVSDQSDVQAQLVSSQAQIEQLQAQLTELQDQFLRARAETENLRRRAQEELEKMHKFAIERFAEHLLPVMDSLEAALLADNGDTAKMQDGVELTLRQLQTAFNKGRVTTICPEVGEKFNPHQHQAIATVPAEQEPNTIVAVLQKGYLIAERVLRPALVTVCQTPSA